MAATAARALAAVTGRRMAGQISSPFLGSCRRGAQNYSNSNQLEEQQKDGDEEDAGTISAAQVEAAQNSKNVEELHEEEVTTLLPEEVIEGLEAETENAWVPDQETGVFAPAEETDTEVHSSLPAPPHPTGTGGDGSSVLDQTVFVRDEDIEDVERPAVDIDIDIRNSIGIGTDGKETETEDD